jgi:hypothetical protein
MNRGHDCGSAATPEDCFFPERRFLHMVLTASREADAASRRQPGSREKSPPPRWRPGCEEEAADYDAAVTLAERAGLSNEEAVALTEAIWTLGASPVELSVGPIATDLGLDSIQTDALAKWIDDLLPPSVTGTVRSLIGSYASAVRQYHRATEDTRGEWPLFSELIPGLASPLKELRTTPAAYAASRLTAALAKMCGHPLDEHYGALWTRVNGRSLSGVGTAIRGLASDYESMQSIEPNIHRRMILPDPPEKAKQPDPGEQPHRKAAERSNGPADPGRP